MFVTTLEFKSKVPPETEDAPVPKAELSSKVKVPAPTVVPPVNVLDEDNVSSPVPDLVIEPPVPLITPATLLAAVLLIVNAFEPKAKVESRSILEPVSVRLPPEIVNAFLNLCVVEVVTLPVNVVLPVTSNEAKLLTLESEESEKLISLTVIAEVEEILVELLFPAL